jgi:hypothetical protein
MSEPTMTPEIADAVGAVSAAMIDAPAQHPALDWQDLIVAGALALRGIAAHARHCDQALSQMAVDLTLGGLFFQVMALPPEVVKIVSEPGDGKHKAGFLPVRRH